jgi:hypothetical protein
MRSLFLLLLFSSCLTAQSDILLSENFNSYAPLNGMFELNGGEGWAGPWTRETGDDGIIQRGDIGPREQTITGQETHASLDFVRAGIRYNRPIELIQDDGRDLWITVVMDWSTGGVAENVGNVTLTRSGSQVLSFGRKFGNRKIAFVLPGGISFESDVLAEGIHLLLVKIEFSGDTGRERAYLWVDPSDVDQPAGGPALASADVSIPEGALSLNSGINGVQLKVEGTPPLKVGYDDLAMGRTFQSVLGDYVISNQNPGINRLPLRVSPVPSNGEVRLQWTMPIADSARTELFDQNGRLTQLLGVRTYPAGEQSTTLNLSGLNLPSGTYVLRVSGSNWLATERIVYVGD